MGGSSVAGMVVDVAVGSSLVDCVGEAEKEVLVGGRVLVGRTTQATGIGSVLANVG